MKDCMKTLILYRCGPFGHFFVDEWPRAWFRNKVHCWDCGGDADPVTDPAVLAVFTLGGIEAVEDMHRFNGVSEYALKDSP